MAGWFRSRVTYIVIMCGFVASALLALIFLAVTRGHMNPAEFAFICLGETTPEQVTKTRGEPWLAYKTSIFDGELDFHDGKLYYALLPTRIWERSSAGLKLRYGRKLKVQRIPFQEFDLRYTAELWSDPGLGIAYFRTTGPLFEAKIIFSPKRTER